MKCPIVSDLSVSNGNPNPIEFDGLPILLCTQYLLSIQWFGAKVAFDLVKLKFWHILVSSIDKPV